MHDVLPQPLLDPGSHYTPDDITAVWCLRAHAGNPWVIERLNLLAGHYDPCPSIVVCDFGSEPPFAGQIESACRDHNFRYVRVDDSEVYSAAAAHNRGFEAAKTDLVFFCDVDSVGRSTLFRELADVASAIGMKDVVDIFLNTPIVHLSEEDTQRCMAARSAPERSRILDRLALEYLYRRKDHDGNAFVAPYSNNFLIHRNLFSLVGGYDERFRGHGSEDFEFFVRLHYYSKHLPLPVDLTNDKNSPMRDEFYAPKDYSGFRRLLEAQSYPAEHFGLRVFHLWHPRNEGGWTDANDWKRVRLKAVLGEYVKEERRLLSTDCIARRKIAICICRHGAHWGYFAPLRLAGYRLVPLYDDEPASLAEATEMIVSGEAGALAVFNPYLKSHADFKTLFMLAQEQGVRTVVIERGALPNTLYYDDDVSYGSAGFSEHAFAQASFTDTELVWAGAYVADLTRGTTLDNMASYETTARRYPGLKLLRRPICLIPVQLEEDMAVTHFVRDGQSYDDFVGTLPSVMEANPDILFIVKPHPLSRLIDMAGKPNLLIAKSDDNIHFLIDAARWVVCYNSGVGLLALMHGKPVLATGNAFYNYKGTGHRATTLASAVEAARRDPPGPSPAMINRLAAWFMLRKYSTFVANPAVVEFEGRKAQGYKDVMVTHFRWDGHDIPLGRSAQAIPYSPLSYLSARVGMSPVPSKKAPVKALPKPTESPSAIRERREGWSLGQRAIYLAARVVLAVVQSEENRRRFKSDPITYLQRAKAPHNRWLGRLLLEESQRPY